LYYCSKMRIIAGAKRGMKLLGPKTQTSRPITDRVKESLFSVLFKYDLPEGKIVADLFSGVGSMGIEALSRGAEFVTFVDKDPKIIAILNKNIRKAGFVKRAKVIKANTFKMGAAVGFNKRKYDLVFVDPPYALTKQAKADSPVSGLLTFLSERLTAGGIVVVRTKRNTELLEQYGRVSAGHLTVETIERRRWGTMAVTIFVARPAPAAGAGKM